MLTSNCKAILAVDVQYQEESAVAAGVLFSQWQSGESAGDRTKLIYNVAPYEPGFFYKRELPCILSLLQDIDSELETIVVDGYVSLGQQQQAGLGAYLYDEMEQKVPVVGVAKSRFKDTPASCEVLRGNSQNPLLVTAAGIPLVQAKQNIAQMHGSNRIPTLLKRVDRLARGIIEPR